MTTLVTKSHLWNLLGEMRPSLIVTTIQGKVINMQAPKLNSIYLNSVVFQKKYFICMYCFIFYNSGLWGNFKSHKEESLQ